MQGNKRQATSAVSRRAQSALRSATPPVRVGGTEEPMLPKLEHMVNVSGYETHVRLPWCNHAIPGWPSQTMMEWRTALYAELGAGLCSHHAPSSTIREER